VQPLSNYFLLLIVLEQNPPKQGLKPLRVEVIESCACVLEQNPPKQGLKHKECIAVCKENRGFRAKSTKTRIETLRKLHNTISTKYVLEQNPPKQGLKLSNIYAPIWVPSCFRAKSTKTRIETK